MATVLLFHHAQGLTEGLRAFADELRRAGHEVVTPDLFDGTVFPTLEEGLAHIEQHIGFDRAAELGDHATEQVAADAVIGFSFGVLPAQRIAQNRPGIRGAVLAFAGIPTHFFGDGWPAGVALQVHVAPDDEMLDEGEADVAVALAEQEAADGEAFRYPGTAHLIVDSSLPSYDPDSARLILERTLAFLGRLA
jgi:dienelactone hydrolase